MTQEEKEDRTKVWLFILINLVDVHLKVFKKLWKQLFETSIFATIGVYITLLLGIVLGCYFKISTLDVLGIYGILMLALGVYFFYKYKKEYSNETK